MCAGTPERPHAKTLCQRPLLPISSSALLTPMNRPACPPGMALDTLWRAWL